MPIVNSEKIVEFFKKNNGKEFLAYIEISDKNKELLERVLVYYPLFLISRGRYISYLRRLYVKFIISTPVTQRNLKHIPSRLYKGSNWFSITGSCMNFILTYIEENPQYDIFFKNTFCGDEIYFHSIIMNSKFKKNVVNDNKRYIDWNTGPDKPRTLTEQDLPKLYNENNNKLWARKLDMDYNFLIFEGIKEKLKIGDRYNSQ